MFATRSLPSATALVLAASFMLLLTFASASTADTYPGRLCENSVNVWVERVSCKYGKALMRQVDNFPCEPRGAQRSCSFSVRFRQRRLRCTFRVESEGTVLHTTCRRGSGRVHRYAFG